MRNLFSILLVSLACWIPASAETNCCSTSECCQPKSACCATSKTPEANKCSSVKTGETKAPTPVAQVAQADSKTKAATPDSCCAPGAACCQEGAACCPK